MGEKSGRLRMQDSRTEVQNAVAANDELGGIQRRIADPCRRLDDARKVRARSSSRLWGTVFNIATPVAR
jgi:hypothetical protein